MIFVVGGGNSVTNLFLGHGGATWQHDRYVRIHADVNVTLHDVVERSVVDFAGYNAMKLAEKKNNTRATETFGADIKCFRLVACGSASCRDSLQSI